MPDNDWRTPPELLRPLRRLGAIALDPFPSPPKLEDLVGARVKLRDSLNQNWRAIARGGLTFCNPSFGREFLGASMQKIFEEAMAGCWIACVVPASTDVGWFHEAMLVYADQVLLRRGRLRYVGRDGKSEQSPLFGSVLFHFAGTGCRRARRLKRFQQIFSPDGIVLPAGDSLRSSLSCAQIATRRPLESSGRRRKAGDQSDLPLRPPRRSIRGAC